MANMNAAVKAQWVAALRSGEYQQGRGSLAAKEANGDWQFCCLGVLCDLAVKAGQPIRVAGLGVEYVERTYDDASALLPRSVVAWAEFDDGASYSGAVEFPGSNGELIDLVAKNDNGSPFAEIADLIEKYL